jgi:hypothetical protein
MVVGSTRLFLQGGAMRITRRHLQVSLGVLWLLDGLLQCQPFMFTRQFAVQVLAPASVGQPSTLADLMHVVGAATLLHPAVANGAFAIIQIVLGLALFTRRFSRPVLAASIVWALSVWIVGEGIGGIAAGGTLLTGAPGAAVLYAVIALLAWPTRERGSGDRPSRLALSAWCALWLMGSGLQLIDGNDSSRSLTMMLRAGESSAPGWVAAIDRHLVSLRLPSWTAAALIALFVLVAVWALVPGWTRQLSIGLGVLISLAGWLLFQGLGDLTSGQATDPNSGPLIVLLAVAVVGAYAREVDERPLDATATSDPIVRASLVGSTGELVA